MTGVESQIVKIEEGKKQSMVTDHAQLNVGSGEKDTREQDFLLDGQIRRVLLIMLVRDLLDVLSHACRRNRHELQPTLASRRIMVLIKAQSARPDFQIFYKANARVGS